jgi:NDP-sugar pyrophosphorylase family protein
MIAIIVAAAKKSEMYGLDEHLPLPLFPLVDRPILHHIIDSLASQGVRRFEFVLGHLPEKIETYLGDGARWGCSFGFHLLPSESDPLLTVERIAASLDDEVVLGRGDRLSDFQLWTAASATLFMTAAGAWTGWAVLPRASGLYASLRSYVSCETRAHALAFREVVVNRELSFENAPELLRSQHDLLSGAFRGSTVGSREKRPGIWISRNVSVNHTAKLLAPVYIGPSCRIGKNARIGPSAVISEGCIVDEQSSVANSVVAPRTYIGRGLELEDVIVDRNRLVNAKLGTAFLVSESFLLSGLARQKKPRMLHGLVSRLGALALFLLLFPIAGLTLIFLLLSGRGELVYERALRLPAANSAHSWKDYRYLRFRLQAETMAGWWTYFVAEVWPGLISVMKGDLFLVGVRPRSRQEVEGLSDDWRSTYLGSKGGLITEAFVMFGRAPSEDELYTAEAYYTATASIWHDIKLLRLYLSRLLINSDRSPAGCPEGSALGSLPEKLLEH